VFSASNNNLPYSNHRGICVTLKDPRTLKNGVTQFLINNFSLQFRILGCHPQVETPCLNSTWGPPRVHRVYIDERSMRPATIPQPNIWSPWKYNQMMLYTANKPTYLKRTQTSYKTASSVGYMGIIWTITSGYYPIYNMLLCISSLLYYITVLFYMFLSLSS